MDAEKTHSVAMNKIMAEGNVLRGSRSPVGGSGSGASQNLNDTSPSFKDDGDAAAAAHAAACADSAAVGSESELNRKAALARKWARRAREAEEAAAAAEVESCRLGAPPGGVFRSTLDVQRHITSELSDFPL